MRPKLDHLRKINTHDSALDLYHESFEWLFYGDDLPGFQRFSLPFSSKVEHCKGATILVSDKYASGTYSVWQTFENTQDVLEYKKKAWDLADTRLEHLEELGIASAATEDIDVERHYPFLAIQINAPDVSKYCQDNALELGRLFTGGYGAYENDYLQKQILDKNLSVRGYERLFIRWTSAMAVYTKQAEYEKAMLRAVQIFETCILVRRLLKNITANADDLASSMRVYIPTQVPKVIKPFLDVQRTFVTAPPVQSVEAERLLIEGYRQFGIEKLIDSTRTSCDFLERQYQWSKTQTAIYVAVALYVVNHFVPYFYPALKWLVQ